MRQRSRRRIWKGMDDEATERGRICRRRGGGRGGGGQPKRGDTVQGRGFNIPWLMQSDTLI